MFLICALICGFAAGILGLIPFVGWVFSTLISVCVVLFMVLGIVNAAKGQAKELPIIGKFRILK